MKPDRNDPAARILEIVAAIPEGRVATYGRVAGLAGVPRGARRVGRVLAELPEGSDIPWHRVVNACGRISPRGDAPIEGFQRHLLLEEGVEFSDTDRIDLDRFGI